MERTVKSKVVGYRTQDGAGVSLVRVLGDHSVDEFDPILMLDSFDSTDPDDYTAGFPLHPHRGIETISYLARGKMTHLDSLGNEDTISDGEVQWMTAGSGIMHEERLPACERMLGVQLWLNLPADEKMCEPAYHPIRKGQIEDIEIEGGVLRLVAGSYKGRTGFEAPHLPFDYYALELEPHAHVVLDFERDRSVMAFTLLGDCRIAGEPIEEKTAVKLTEGDTLSVETGDTPAQVLVMSSQRLDEPVHWGGPIVMDTRAGLLEAFDELDRGTFIKGKIRFDA
ncbi:pirin [Berryella intestinalis]|uniref:Pirin n=1 Tax=Berryella intestinalis TaxID=1531429 RepID=A0A0A8B9D4_9ACTN|nr:pirin family protein [Berryella intestinalis]AJC11747.1 pirin [Berryella intestinalis]